MGHQATQHLCLTIRNNLHKGDITFKNLISIRYAPDIKSRRAPLLSNDHPSGQPYEKDKNLRLLSAEDVEKIIIRPGESKLISFCGSGALGLGIEGMLDIHADNEARITSLYWNGPWDRVGNQFHVSSTDNEHYSLSASIPPNEGILGDISVEVGGLAES